MMLTTVIDAYVAKQRSLGMRFESGDVVLRRFCRAIGNRDIGEVTTQALKEFLQGSGPLSATWMLRYRTLSGLYRFAISRGYATFSPLPTVLPKLPPPQTPYVYSKEELGRLLDATSILRVRNSHDVPAMYRTLLLLLYGSGMRIGEALRLTYETLMWSSRSLPSTTRSFSKHASFQSGQSSPRNWSGILSAFAACIRGLTINPRFSARAVFGRGVMIRSSLGSSMYAVPLE